MLRKVPPLNALKAFEASARLGSFVLAAAELHVTPGAVSQHIHKLENFFGRQLFIRRNNQITLTDVGVSVQAASAEMMDGLAALTRRLIDGTTRSNLVISVLPSLLTRWFNRYLPEFLQANPDVRVDLRLEEDPVDFYRNRIDIRLSYGEHLYPELVTIPFRRDRVTFMCTPQLLQSDLAQPGILESLRDEQLIHVSWRNGFSSYPTWESWFTGAGAPRQPRHELGHIVDTSSLAIDLARSGAGIALGQYMLAEDELERGVLITPFSNVVVFQYQYCIVHTPANAHNPTLQAFAQWLTTLPDRRNG